MASISVSGNYYRNVYLECLFYMVKFKDLYLGSMHFMQIVFWDEEDVKFFLLLNILV